MRGAAKRHVESTGSRGPRSKSARWATREEVKTLAKKTRRQVSKAEAVSGQNAAEQRVDDRAEDARDRDLDSAELDRWVVIQLDAQESADIARILAEPTRVNTLLRDAIRANRELLAELRKRGD